MLLRPGQGLGRIGIAVYYIAKFTPDNKQFDCFTVNVSPPVSKLNQWINSNAGLFMDMQ